MDGNPTTLQLIERINLCMKMIGDICKEGRPPKMRIPAEHDENNEDLFICDTFRMIKTAILESDVKATLVDAARNSALREAMRVKVKFPEWINDPSLGDLYTSAIIAKNEAIERLIDVNVPDEKPSKKKNTTVEVVPNNIFMYEIEEELVIKATQHPCRVVGRRELHTGSNDYLVVWWNNGERQEASLYEWELSKTEGRA